MRYGHWHTVFQGLELERADKFGQKQNPFHHRKAGTWADTCAAGKW
jgi:hypothetical protein